MLKIKFWRIKNVILMKILEQGDEIERGNFEFKASNDTVLTSKRSPQIAPEDLYIRGENRSLDENVVPYNCDTSEEAREQLKAYVEAVREYNNSLQQSTGDVEDIETVIAE